VNAYHNASFAERVFPALVAKVDIFFGTTKGKEQKSKHRFLFNLPNLKTTAIFITVSYTNESLYSI
jgi:hypothetical protein